MFVAHLAAGYLSTVACQRLLPKQNLGPSAKTVLLIGLLASVLPDFDLLYFYFIDQRQSTHHSYWTHFPSLWLLLGLAAVAILWRRREWLPLLCIVEVNLLLHLALDSIVGGIAWLGPWFMQYSVLVHVPAHHDWWVLNFLLHWSFGLELVLIASALGLAYRRYQYRGAYALAQE